MLTGVVYAHTCIPTNVCTAAQNPAEITRHMEKAEWMAKLETKPVGAFVIRATEKAYAALTVVSVQRRGAFEVWSQLIHDKQGECVKTLTRNVSIFVLYDSYCMTRPGTRCTTRTPPLKPNCKNRNRGLSPVRQCTVASTAR